MFEKFLGKFLLYAASLGLLLGWLIILIGSAVFESNVYGWVFTVSIFLFLVAYLSYKDLVGDAVKAKQIAEQKEQLWKQTLKERTAGFPTLFSSIAYYEQLFDERLSNYLRTKPHPAVSSPKL